MKIQLGKFFLTSDRYGYTLSEEKTYGETSKKVGQTFMEPFAYFSDFEAALKGYERHALLRSKATTLQEIADLKESIAQEVKVALRSFNEVI